MTETEKPDHDDEIDGLDYPAGEPLVIRREWLDKKWLAENTTPYQFGDVDSEGGHCD